MKLTIEDGELINLYKYLKSNEINENFKLNSLLKKIENLFYEEYSIEDLEDLLYSCQEKNL